MSNSNAVPPQPGARSASSGPQSAGAQGPHSSSLPQTPAPQPSTPSQQNLNQIVIEYLNKKGYHRTEAILRQESAHLDSRGRIAGSLARAEDRGGQKYFVAFPLLLQWIEDNLEIYKPELRRVLWPVFVYSFLELVDNFYAELAGKFFDDYSKSFSREHEVDLRSLQNVRHPEHMEANATAKIYWSNKYRLTLTHAAFISLIQFLENKEREGGSVINSILQAHLNIVTVDRTSVGAERSLAAIIARNENDADLPDEDEGIPGHNPGSANTDPKAPPVLTRLNLGPLPMEAEMSVDVREELEEEDVKNPAAAGRPSLVEEFDQQIKREPSEDAPNRDNLPLPKPLARDVAMEVQRIKENRDRFRILETREGGIGPGVSVTMFTFHNTFDSINCLDFSADNLLVAAGTAESYIRVWSLEGKPMPSLITDPADAQPASSRRLIGHSGPVYAVSFSPSAANEDPANNPETNARYLLSCSADKTVRLWSLEAWTCLVVYKGHDNPVWDVSWGPFGHYFVTGGHDQTARLWSTDHIAPLRIFAGHDQDVDCVAFHPNNAYVFTGSSDKTVRMWDVSRGSAVRLFTGHSANVTVVSCSPNGKKLASADDSGAIILWDLASGRRIKRMRGHGRGGIWSLAWSVESTVLVSGGADQTVRVWDVLMQTEGVAQGRTGADGSTGARPDGTTVPAGVTAVGGSAALKKGKGREAGVSIDQISAFPTKKSPVYRVRFTNMNLVLAGGAYLP